MLRWNKFGSDLLRRFHMSENSVLIVISVVLGLSTATAVLLFREAFHFFEYFFVDIIGEHGFLGNGLQGLGLDPRLSILLVLTSVGAIVGSIVQVFIGHERHHGVAGIMESVALAGGRLKYAKVPFKELASALSLGAGASLGPEDPSVQIGANLGSFFGEHLRLSEERVKLLVASGAASAIATAFNAPIAGVFFALEVILGEFTTRSFGVVVLSAVIASSTARYLTGANPVFGNLNFELGSPAQLPFYVLLGLILAFASSTTIRFFHWQSDFWHNNINVPPPIKTALTGTLIALVGLFLPQILGPGEQVMHDLLSGHGETAIALLILLGLAKLVMTAISQGGGFQGVYLHLLYI
jgi:CIC family chloride channel protein